MNNKKAGNSGVLNFEVLVLNVEVPVLKAGKSPCTRTQRTSWRLELLI
jgi:hypothetical protein